ncbi:hypothetical protein [Actinophytocola glycyrrhizae]|uniref:SMODS-associating 2TM beta-strand rich effector domain-containing protein n=1 Tax=Actinophytocola glycyrrhizae TaxID=2044873 RepID=A0ABV9SJ95_9PSEU
MKEPKRRNATRLYVGGVSLLFLAGVGAEVLGHLLFDERSFWYALLTGLGEALLISAILATLVDPFLKRKMQVESVWTGIFALMKNEPPDGLQEAIKDLAKVKIYYPSTTWTLTFEWADDDHEILKLTLDVRSVGRNISRQPYMLTRKAWILASTTGYTSEYLRYAVSCPDEIEAIDADSGILQRHITSLEDGSITVDEAGLSKGQSISPGKSFETIKVARMYRHSTGYIPLYHGKFGENLEVRLTGEAMADIDVRISHPTFEGQTHLTERSRPAARPQVPTVAQFERMIPGQITIIAWHPAADDQTPRQIDLPATPDNKSL